MRALVTGSAGFLGRHFVAELRARGCWVAEYDVKNGAWNDCRRVFESDVSPEPPVDLAIHCAAVIGGRAQIDGDPLATAESIELDVAYLRWVARVRPAHAVYVSSSAVYPVDLQGERDSIWQPERLTEDMQHVFEARIGTPDQVYGWSKLVGERLAYAAGQSSDVPVTVVRPFSGYGADQDLDYPFPSFVRRAQLRQDPFVVWGSGRQTRDFIHVDDVIAGTLAVVDRDRQRAAAGEFRFDPVNLCTGRSTSFDQLAEIVTKVAGYSPTVRCQPDAPTGVQHRVGDPTKMREVYAPRVTLEEGVWRALDAARST